MEENKCMITCNSFKLDLNACKFKTEIDNANQTKVYKSKKSNSSSLFSDDEENSNQNNCSEDPNKEKHHLCSLSPAKRLYSDHIMPFSSESVSFTYNEDGRLKHSSSVNKKIERKKPAFPPPLSLYPKSQLPAEPLRSGCNIPFLKRIHTNGCTDKLKDLNKKSKSIKESESKIDATKNSKSEMIKKLEEIEAQKGKRNFKAMFFKEFKNCERNPIVFSRYSQSCYDPNEKLPEDFQLSYFLNIKRLVSEQEEACKDLLIPYLEKPINELVNKIKPYYEPIDEDDKTLVFESRYECGNLNYALKISDNEYNLLLQNDINTNGHTQWFYFRVSNTRENMKIKFNILNFAKPDSLFNYGMQILCFSELH